MKEAIIAIVVPKTEMEPAHTEVYRLEFEGEFGDFIEMVENFATQTRVVAYDQLTAS